MAKPRARISCFIGATDYLREGGASGPTATDSPERNQDTAA